MENLLPSDPISWLLVAILNSALLYWSAGNFSGFRSKSSPGSATFPALSGGAESPGYP